MKIFDKASYVDQKKVVIVACKCDKHRGRGFLPQQFSRALIAQQRLFSIPVGTSEL